MKELQTLVSECFQYRALLDQASYRDAVIESIRLLDQGNLSVVEKISGEWIVHTWVKEAILLFFQISQMTITEVGPFEYFDKIPLKKDFAAAKIRVVPPATVRYGSFIEEGAILMPSYVNIGAHIGSGTMIDTWSTVGSCAYVGKAVHVSGGVGIGGVLEPAGARPVIIEDGAFLGSRCIVVEGVVVEEDAVLGANVVLTASTKIIDVTQAQPVTLTGRVPARSVVIPGTTSKQFPAGEYGVPCALIIGKRSESTDKKTSLNQALRDFSLSV